MRLRGAGVVAGLTMLLAVAPAGAEVLGEKGGLIYVKQQGVLPQGPGTQAAEATAQCPDGSVHVGGGTTVTGSPTGTAISTSGPTSSDEWDSSGWHTGINSTDETITAWLICTEKVEKISAEVEIVEVFDAPGGESGTPLCVEGHATSGGVLIPGPTADWWLNSTNGVDTGDADANPDDGWATWVHHLNGPGADIITIVVCMAGKEPVYRLQVEGPRTRIPKKLFGIEGHRSGTAAPSQAVQPPTLTHLRRRSIPRRTRTRCRPTAGRRSLQRQRVDQLFTAAVLALAADSEDRAEMVAVRELMNELAPDA